MNYQPSTPELLRVAGLPEDTPVDSKRTDYADTMRELSLARRAFYIACATEAPDTCGSCVNRAERMCDLADKVYAEHGIRVVTASQKAAETSTKAEYTPPRTEVPTTPASFQ